MEVSSGGGFWSWLWRASTGVYREPYRVHRVHRVYRVYRVHRVYRVYRVDRVYRVRRVFIYKGVKRASVFLMTMCDLEGFL